MDIKKRMFSLYRYFLWADRMRVHFDQLLRSKPKLDENGISVDEFLYMSYWYGATYVVVEGWQSLKIPDSKIDNLLKSPNVDLLKRYRNGTFHFQKDYFDKRFLGFIQEGQNSAVWIRDLREEFSRFFLDFFVNNKEFQIKP